MYPPPPPPHTHCPVLALPYQLQSQGMGTWGWAVASTVSWRSTPAKLHVIAAQFHHSHLFCVVPVCLLARVLQPHTKTIWVVQKGPGCFQCFSDAFEDGRSFCFLCHLWCWSPSSSLQGHRILRQLFIDKVYTPEGEASVCVCVLMCSLIKRFFYICDSSPITF